MIPDAEIQRKNHLKMLQRKMQGLWDRIDFSETYGVDTDVVGALWRKFEDHEVVERELLEKGRR